MLLYKVFVCPSSCGHEFNVSRPVLWQDDGQRLSGGRLWCEYSTSEVSDCWSQLEQAAGGLRQPHLAKSLFFGSETEYNFTQIVYCIKFSKSINSVDQQAYPA